MGCGSRVTTGAKALMGKLSLVWKEESMVRAWRARGEQQEVGWGGGTTADTEGLEALTNMAALEGLGGTDKHGGLTLSAMGAPEAF